MTDFPMYASATKSAGAIDRSPFDWPHAEGIEASDQDSAENPMISKPMGIRKTLPDLALRGMAPLRRAPLQAASQKTAWLGKFISGIVLAAGLLALEACGTTQRLSGPLNQLGKNAPTVAQPRAGATQVTVIRQAEGVRVQRAGAPQGFALDSANPSTVAMAGSIVRTAGAGRAEVLWDGSPASVVLLGPGALLLGDKGLQEPMVSLLYLTRANVNLGASDEVELPGGARMIGDPDRASGPFQLAEAGLGSLTLSNQSVRPLRMRIGGLEVEIEGGAVVEIPATKAADGPPQEAVAEMTMSPAEPLDRIQAGSLALGVRGEVTWTESDGRVELTAGGPCEIHAMGLVLRLEAGESASIGSLRRGSK